MQMEFAEQREEKRSQMGNGARCDLLRLHPAFASLLAARSKSCHVLIEKCHRVKRTAGRW